MSLFLRFLGLKHNPSKNYPVPFITTMIGMSDGSYAGETFETNSIPPIWKDQVFSIQKPDPTASLQILIKSSSILMSKEIIGRCEIRIESFPVDQLVLEWVPIIPVREGIPKMFILLMAHFVNEIPPFKAQPGALCTQTETIPFDPKDNFYLPDEMVPKDLNSEQQNGSVLSEILEKLS
ncbi:C2 domain containing protein [Histomonas meleagridis]|uniref:C2 domain containing protein n=1 Tax=Histomonas meleagridis TaxID=135588 RepID=UPI00355A898B|nr:C2 domain containing protein [Histomonas meleagridis]KAH0799712.1 C2 domain containing protein [Histomonas meleagridis]